MRPSPRAARRAVWLGLALGLAAPIVVAVAALGRVFGLLSWPTAFGTMTLEVAPVLGWIGLAGGLLAVAAAVWARPRWLWVAAVVAIVAPAATLVGFAGLRAVEARTPPLWDVATDWTDPVLLSGPLLARRGPEAAAVERDPRLPEPWRPAGAAVPEAWAANRVADLNRLACPGARAVPRLAREDEVRRVLEAEGVLVSGAAAWRVEGTARTFWFHVEDDVAVRMRPGRTDVRSVSRLGERDYGRNCARVTRIVAALNAGAR